MFVRPAPGVSLLIAIPGASSLHLSAYGPQVSASALGLAMAELRRRGELPWGLEMAELARAQVGWGLGRQLGLPGAIALGDALGASPLDPLSQALEQGQRAAVALIEAADDLGTLPSRLEGLLAFPLADVSHARVALSRMTRAQAGAPRALARAHARAPLHGGGLFFGVGPLAHEARRALWRPSLAGPVRGLWRDQGPGRPTPPAPLRPIYVVDDDPVQRTLLCEFLAGRGLPVRAVDDELGLLAAAADEPPGAVLLDVVLHWVDGLRLCGALRRHPATRHTPVFIVSGLTRPSDRQAALRAGATRFFAKPVDLAALALALAELRAPTRVTGPAAADLGR